MAVTQVTDFEDEDQDIARVYVTARERGGFGRNDDPPFYVSFASREEKHSALAEFGSKCLNCGEDHQFTRDCPASYMNVSKITTRHR